MPQQDMLWEVFTGVLDSLPKKPHVVSLQGEGEPTLHPRFWDMVDEVKARGFEPFTISNGYWVDTQRIARNFKKFAISIDTLDGAESERIGRYKLGKVLETLDQLVQLMGADRLRIMTVDYGQYLAPLRQYLNQRGVADHLIQKLQQKKDYAPRYSVISLPLSGKHAYRCRFVESDRMRFFDVNDTQFPCCFIKDSRQYASASTIKNQLAAGQIPHCCRGCREITRKQSAPNWMTPLNASKGFFEYTG